MRFPRGECFVLYILFAQYTCGSDVTPESRKHKKTEPADD